MYTIDQVEDAILARLNGQIAYLKTCTSLGEWLSDLADLEDITIRYPAAYLFYDGGEYDQDANVVQDRRMRFTVLVMVKSLRGQEAARHGQGAEKGAYDLLDDVRAALSNQACGLDIDPLLPVDEAAVEGTREQAIYAIRFETRCRFTL